MSPDREARILIVDDQREVARVMRTALELSNRNYHVIDVPSGEEALLEMGQTYDLVISDFRLPGMSGVELLERIHKVQSSINMILMSAHSLDEVNLEARELDLFDVLEKPIDMDAFVATVNRAVSGTEELPRLMPVTAADDRPLPEFDTRIVTNKLSKLRADLGAVGLAFIARTGKVLLKQGTVDEVPRFGELAVLLASNFTTTAEISTYLGDDRSTAVHYYDGNWYDIFALSVGVNFFVAVVYPGGSQRHMGTVLRIGKPGVREIIDLINEDREEESGEADGVADRPATLPPPTIESVEEWDDVFAELDVDEPEPEPATDEALQDALMTLMGEDGEIETIDANLEEMDLELDDTEITDVDGFWEDAAASEETKISTEALSMSEAIELGLIPKDANIEEE